MKIWPLLLVALVAGCAGRIETTASASLPLECVPPTFEAGQCVVDVPLNRQLCRVGGDLWTLYPSGETWRVEDPADGRRDPVICHVLADGTVQWMR